MAKILFIGPVHEELQYLKQVAKGLNCEFPIGSGQFHMVKALQELGHSVLVFRYTEPSLVPKVLTSTIYKNLPNQYVKLFLHGLLYKYTRSDLSADINLRNKKLLRIASTFHPDITIISGGDLIFPSTIKHLKNHGPVVLLYGAIPSLYSNKNLLKSIQTYDWIFVNDPGHIGFFEEYGGVASFLPIAACDPSYHRSIELSNYEKKMLSTDVSFVGSLYANRIAHLQALTDFDLGLWGPRRDWNRLQGFPLYHLYRGEAMLEKWVRIYNASKIALNFLEPNGCFAPVNMRFFEAPSCGVLQLVQFNPGISHFFELGSEILCFRDVNELKEQICFCINNPDRCKEIAMRGQVRAHRDHTYAKRMNKLISTILGGSN